MLKMLVTLRKILRWCPVSHQVLHSKLKTGCLGNQ